MDISFVPTLADAIKGYYEQNELVELCDLYDIDLDFDGTKPAYMRLARDLFAQINDPKSRRFLNSIVQSLLNRAREGTAKSKWDRQEYHRAMVDNLRQIKSHIETITSELEEAEGTNPFLSTIEDVASLLRTDSKTVTNLLESGQIDDLKIGSEWRVKTEAVFDFLNRQVNDQKLELLLTNLKDHNVWARELSKFPELERRIKETDFEEGTMGAFLKHGVKETKSKSNNNTTISSGIVSSDFRDVFICHASEDKENIVEPLVRALDKEGISYWYDRAEITWGDSLTKKVNQGLKISKFVIVVLTKGFMSKPWPRRELDSALSIEAKSGSVKVLPLLCGGTTEREEILNELPLLNDKYYVVWDYGPDNIICELGKRLRASGT